MARTQIDDDTEELLISIFDTSSGLQRRVLRMIARGHWNAQTVGELTTKLDSLKSDISEIEAITKVVSD